MTVAGEQSGATLTVPADGGCHVVGCNSMSAIAPEALRNEFCRRQMMRMEELDSNIETMLKVCLLNLKHVCYLFITKYLEK